MPCLNAALPRADAESAYVVHVQQVHRRASAVCTADYSGAVTHKMLLPSITPRIVQNNDCTGFRIDRCEVASFAAIAVAYEQVFGLGEVQGSILPPPPPSFT